MPPMQQEWAPAPLAEGGPRVLLSGPVGVVKEAGVLHVLFDRPMDPGVRLQTEPPIEGEQQWWSPQTLVFIPRSPLPLATYFTAWVDEGALAADGTPLTEGALWTFSTRRPSLVSVTPEAGAMLPATDQVMTLTWDQPMDLSSLQERLGLSRLYEKYRAVPFSLRYVLDSKGQEDKTRIRVLPRRRLPPGSRVDLTLQSGAQGLEGRLPSQRTWQHHLVVATANASPVQALETPLIVPSLVLAQQTEALAKMSVAVMPTRPRPGQPYWLTGVLSPPPNQALRARLLSASGEPGPTMPVHLDAEGGFHLQATAQAHDAKGPGVLRLETLEGKLYAQHLFSVGSPMDTADNLTLRAQHSVLTTEDRLQVHVQSSIERQVHVTLERWTEKGWRASSLCQVQATLTGAFCGFSPGASGVYRVSTSEPDAAVSKPGPSLMLWVKDPQTKTRALRVDVDLPAPGQALRVRVLEGDTAVDAHVSLAVTQPGGQPVAWRAALEVPKEGAKVWVDDPKLRDTLHIDAFAFDAHGRHGQSARLWPASGPYALRWPLPARLRQGDHLVSTMHLSAAQETAATWTVWAEPAGLLKIDLAQDKATLSPKPHEVLVKVKTLHPGATKLCVKVSGKETQATRCHELEIQPEAVYEVHTTSIVNKALRMAAPEPNARLHHIGIAHGPQASAWSLWRALENQPPRRTLRDELGRIMALTWLLEPRQKVLLGPEIVRQVREGLALHVQALAELQLPEGYFASWEAWGQADIFHSIWAVMALEDAQNHTTLPKEVLSKAQGFMALLLERHRVPLTLRRLTPSELSLATFWRARRSPQRLSIARDLEPLRAQQKEMSRRALITLTRSWAALGPTRKKTPPQTLLRAILRDPELVHADLYTQAQALSLLAHFAPDARRTQQLAASLRKFVLRDDLFHQIMALRALEAFHAKRASNQNAKVVRILQPVDEGARELVIPLPDKAPGLSRMPDATWPWVGLDPQEGGALTAHLTWQIKAQSARNSGAGWSLTRTLSPAQHQAGALWMRLRLVVPEMTEGILLKIPLPSGATAVVGAQPPTLGALRAGELTRWRDGEAWMVRLVALDAGVYELPVLLIPGQAGELQVPAASLSVAGEATPWAVSGAAVWEVEP